jgi:hypothetical protein
VACTDGFIKAVIKPTLVEQKIRVIALFTMQVLAVLIHNLKDLSFVMAMIVFT